MPHLPAPRQPEEGGGMIRATIARGDGLLPADQYACSRCGRIAKFSVTRRRPELCRDCRDLASIDTLDQFTTTERKAS